MKPNNSENITAGGHYYLKIIFWALVTLYLVVRTFRIGYITTPDSAGYIDNILLRPLLYPLVIDFFQVTCKDFFLDCLYIFQIIAGISTVNYAVWRLQKYFDLKFGLCLIIYVILLLPYGVLPGITSINIGNLILTESVSYNLFIFSFIFLLDSIKDSKAVNILRFIILSCLTTLARPQFIFLYALIVLYLFYVGWAEKNYKKTALFLIVLSLVIFTAGIMQKSYNYFYNGYYGTAPFTGLFLILPQVYLMDSSEISIFSEKDEAFFAKAISDNVEKRKLSAAYSPDTRIYLYYFRLLMNSSLPKAIFEAYAKIYGVKDIGNMSREELVRFDSMTKKVALKLLKVNFMKYLRFIYKGFIQECGHGFFYVLFMVYVMSYNLISIFKCDSKMNLIVFLTILTHLMNYMLIVSVNLVEVRYTFYTDILSVVILIIYFDILVSKKCDFEKVSCGS